MQSVLLLLAARLLVEYVRERDAAARRGPDNRRRGGIRGRLWSRRMLLERPIHGHYDQLLRQLQFEGERGTHKSMLRIGPELFFEMMEKLQDRLLGIDTNMRNALSVGNKLACVLRFLATGNSYQDLHFCFRMSASSISKYVPIVCRAIIDVYSPEVMKCPATPEEWKEVAQGFSSKRNYFNCIGALDGQHIAIECPPGGGSLFYNCKKFHSIILMAL